MTTQLFSNQNGATFSECGKYRNELHRIWDETKPLAMCIGLNPSTANSEKNDPTIRILIDMLKILGYGGFYMLNIFTIISSKPEILLNPYMETEGGARFWIHKIKDVCQDVIFCWGDFKEAKPRAAELKSQFPEALCFDKSKSGAPIHPLAMQERNGRNPNNPKLIKYNNL